MGVIVLTGFMATGKSEVGRRLARCLGRAFVDTDQMIESRAGKSVAAIFASEGEPEFRRLERAAVADVVTHAEAVVALGGGAVLDPANVACVRQAGVLVCLTARPDTILARVGDVTRRPLLAGGDPRAAVERLLAERREAYETAADLMVDTSDRTIDEVVDAIRDELPALERGGRWKSST
jgi:shikimate kinase